LKTYRRPIKKNKTGKELSILVFCRFTAFYRSDFLYAFSPALISSLNIPFVPLYLSAFIYSALWRVAPFSISGRQKRKLLRNQV